MCCQIFLHLNLPFVSTEPDTDTALCTCKFIYTHRTLNYLLVTLFTQQLELPLSSVIYKNYIQDAFKLRCKTIFYSLVKNVWHTEL